MFKKMLVGLTVVAVASAAQATILSPSKAYATYDYSGSTLSPVFAGDAAEGEMSRIYETFNLPGYAAGTAVTSATFTISTDFRYNDASNPLGLYAVNSDTPASSWATNPALGALITSFNPAQGATSQSFDVTAFINSQYSGDGKATLAIAGLTEGQGQNSWTYFFQQDGALNVTIGEGTGLPEPSTMALLGLGALGVAASRRKTASKQ